MEGRKEGRNGNGMEWNGMVLGWNLDVKVAALKHFVIGATQHRNLSARSEMFIKVSRIHSG